MKHYASNTQIICGIDEAGRGALAGPLVAAAVLLPCPLSDIATRANIKKVKDGKLLTPKQRTAVYQALKTVRATIAVQVITVEEINTYGIGWANKEAMRRLVQHIDAPSYILDGNLRLGTIDGKTGRIQSVIDADATVPEVMVAGIVAKVTRDKLMRKLHKEIPHYRFWTNKGYGTKDHIQAIKLYSSSPHHRTIFVKTVLKNFQFSNSNSQ